MHYYRPHHQLEVRLRGPGRYLRNMPFKFRHSSHDAVQILTVSMLRFFSQSRAGDRKLSDMTPNSKMSPHYDPSGVHNDNLELIVKLEEHGILK